MKRIFLVLSLVLDINLTGLPLIFWKFIQGIHFLFQVFKFTSFIVPFLCKLELKIKQVVLIVLN